jgi:hypothetical protein
MKTQLQIVQDALARLDKMDREEFVDSLLAAGLIEPEPALRELFFLTVSMNEGLEAAVTPHALDVPSHGFGTGNSISFAF